MHSVICSEAGGCIPGAAAGVLCFAVRSLSPRATIAFLEGAEEERGEFVFPLFGGLRCLLKRQMIKLIVVATLDGLPFWELAMTNYLKITKIYDGVRFRCYLHFF